MATSGGGLTSKDFERMCKESLISERLVRDFLTEKFRLQFHMVPPLEQKINADLGYHIPDLLCVEKPYVAFEVKEDIKSSKTQNLCFEVGCLTRMRAWGWRANVRNIYLLYVNHYDFNIDVFELGMNQARLELELLSLSERNKQCKLISGTEAKKDLYLLPIPLARSLSSCVTKRFFSNVDLFLFAKAARAKLIR